MEQKTFERFRSLIYEKSGISLGPQKVALVSARVGKRMRALGMNHYGEYLEYVTGDDSGTELVQLLDAISTNVTSFFREPQHFDFLSDSVARWHAQGQRRFRIWSAASSTGEEPYTIAMTLLETLGAGGLDARILATDISTRVLEACLRGRYLPSKLDPVPTQLRSRYFVREGSGQDGHYRVTDTLKELVTFRRLNLSTPPYPMQGPMDVIFCRNVMIYFDDSIRRRLVSEMYRLLKPGGYLMIGHSESLTSIQSRFRSVRPAVYIKT